MSAIAHLRRQNRSIKAPEDLAAVHGSNHVVGMRCFQNVVVVVDVNVVCSVPGNSKSQAPEVTGTSAVRRPGSIIHPESNISIHVLLTIRRV